MTSTQLAALIQAAVVFGTVIMYGAIGEIITEKSGNLNLGVPGIMYLGGIAGLAVAFIYENSVADPSRLVSFLLSFGAAFLAAALGGLIFSILTISLRVNQNVTGLTLTIFGGGVGQISVARTSSVYRATLPGVSSMSPMMKAVLGYGFMVYLAIVLAIFATWFLNRTHTGLNLRAVGESPATADAAGINVTKYKYLATCIGAGISGLGGLYYVMDYIKGTWANDGAIETLGWLAVALVIFALWKPVNATWGSYLFGVLFWLYYYIQGLNRASQEIFKMLPYIVTIAVLVIVSIRRKRDMGPASLGLSYFREER